MAAPPQLPGWNQQQWSDSIVRMSFLHSSRRPPAPLRPEDYDHEIGLVDHTSSLVIPVRTSSRQPAAAEERPNSPSDVSDSSSRRHSDVPLHKKSSTLRKEITRRKYAKYQDRRLEEGLGSDDGQADEGDARGDLATNGEVLDGEERGRRLDVKKKQKQPESVIDILYENQRGGFLCTVPLFSGRALGNLDPSPWTNAAQKTSATDITNAQVPDPSWEWAWKEWTINHTEEVDEDGWEYSFAFSKKFSWHGPAWWKSFVRRRAWIRKRVKKHVGYQVNEAHMLNEDYFTIHPAMDRSRSRASTADGSLKNRYSVHSLAKREMEEEVAIEDIHDIPSLMIALKSCRIDREKMEVIESFIEHGGDELYYLRERMHDVMGLFIFQASRRLLLTHLYEMFNDASDEVKKDSETGRDPDPVKQRRLENLDAAVQHADEEVKKLEFWSDVKDMAEKGETKGAVDASQGWDQSWTGLDESGPKDVISKRELPGMADCKEYEENEIANPAKSDRKGKGKAKE